MNLVLGLSTQFWNFQMQTIDDLSFYFHEGFKLLFLLILGQWDSIDCMYI